MKKIAPWFFLLVVILLGLLVGYYFKDRLFPKPTPSVVPLTKASPTVKPGWKEYVSAKYGFSISYPSSYRIVEDTYGWPKAVILLYKGGQSYDLAIEVWDSETEYQTKYKNQTNLVVKKIGNKFITLLNMNFDPEVDEIIKTFKVPGN